MQIEDKTKLEGFKPEEDICAACLIDLEQNGWVFLCDWCQDNLYKIYHLEVTEIETDSGEVYSI